MLIKHRSSLFGSRKRKCSLRSLLFILFLLMAVWIRFVLLLQSTIHTSSESVAGKIHTLEKDNNENDAEMLDTRIITSPAPWKISPVIPGWMHSYFQWHWDAVQSLQNGTKSVNDYQYMVIRCLDQDSKCGGTADRLKPLPYFVLAAHRLRRLLFFHWQKPAPLSTFLVPAKEGLQWIWPPHPDLQNHSFPSKPVIYDMDTLHSLIGYFDEKKTAAETIMVQKKRYEKYKRQLPAVTCVLVQSHWHGLWEYDALIQQQQKESHMSIASTNSTAVSQDEEATYTKVYRHLWYSVFRPSPPIQDQIDETLRQLDLSPHHYQGIHLRMHYQRKFSTEKVLEITQKAINCLMELPNLSPAVVTPSTRVFCAADTKSSVRGLVRAARHRGLPFTTTRVNLTASEEEETPTLHLDRGANLVRRRNEPPPQSSEDHHFSAYYETFVDLYVLSQAQCLVVTIGNFGKWANLLSRNPECYIHHNDKRCEEKHNMTLTANK